MRIAAASLALLAAVVAALALGPARGAAEPPPVFTGLATWVDIYDGVVYSAPEATARRIAARGVRTVYAETANFRSPGDVFRPGPLGRFVDALQARGVAVVGWYLPGFDRPARDLRRMRAMLAFRTPSGRGFDGVGLDIEATSTVPNARTRTNRMLSLARALRAEAGTLPVAAIPIAPRQLERRTTAWPGFPWAELDGLVDAWVPMIYTGRSFRGYEATYGYVARSLALLRAWTGNPDVAIHAAGGVANRMTADDLAGFVDAVRDDGRVAGWSLYDYTTTGPSAWRALARLTTAP